MSNIASLAQTLKALPNNGQKVQTAWAKVKAVDWGAKTMDVTGVADELEYYDVSLGLGHFFRKPAAGSLCLIGLVENREGAAFLIDAEKVEEAIWETGTSKLTVKKEGFLMERGGESLTKLLKDFLKAIGQSTYTNGAGTTSPPNNLADFQQLLTRLDNLLK